MMKSIILVLACGLALSSCNTIHSSPEANRKALEKQQAIMRSMRRQRARRSIEPRGASIGKTRNCIAFERRACPAHP